MPPPISPATTTAATTWTVREWRAAAPQVCSFPIEPTSRVAALAAAQVRRYRLVSGGGQQHQAAVVATEAEGIREDRRWFPGSRLAVHDRNRDLGVGLGVAGRRRDGGAVDGEHRRHRLDGAGGGQAMSGHPLGGGDERGGVAQDL